MAPERGCIAVVEISDGFAESFSKTAANIESHPTQMSEIGGPARTENAIGTGGPGRVKPYHGNIG